MRTDHQTLLAVCFLYEWEGSNLNLGYIMTVLRCIDLTVVKKKRFGLVYIVLIVRCWTLSLRAVGRKRAYWSQIHFGVRAGDDGESHW